MEAMTGAPVFRKGEFSLELAFRPMSGDLAPLDRQFAWQLYVELATRQALRGDFIELTNASCTPETYAREVDSLHVFLERARSLLAAYPAGRLDPSEDKNLAWFLARVLTVVVCPYLQKWGQRGQVGSGTPHPDRLKPELLSDRAEIQAFSRATIKAIAGQYGFVDLLGAMHPGLSEAWQETGE